MATPYKHKPVAFGLPFHGLTLGAEPRNILMNPARVPGPNATDLDGPNGYDWKSRLLIPGVVGLSNKQIIYIDTAKTPYLIGFEIYQESTFVVRVIATLRTEFGVFGEARPDWNTEIFNQTVDLSDGSDASYTAVSSVPLSGAVEQDPDGRNTLLNIKGLFGSSEELDAGIRTLAGILKASITGAVNPDTGAGLSGSVTVYKTTAECSPPKSSEAYDTAATQYVSVQTAVKDVTSYANAYGNSFGAGVTGQATHERSITINTGSAPSAGVKDGNGIGAPDFTDFSTGGTGTLETQSVIHRAYYDNSGAPHAIGFRLEYDLASIQTNSFSVVSADFIYKLSYGDWSDSIPQFPDDIAGDLQEGGLVILQGGYSVDVRLIDQDETGANQRKTYITHSLMDGAIKESVEYVYRKVDESDVTRDWRLHDPHFGNYVVQDDQPWDGGTFYQGGISTPVTGEDFQAGQVDDDIIGWDNYSITSQYYEVTEWGVSTQSGIGSPPADKGFSSVSRQIIGSRFVALVRDDASESMPAHSAYGSTGADHALHIAYDPYTDTITDSDDPIGYL